MKKINTLKVFQSIKVGNSELVFIKSDEYFIELEGQFITIECKKTGIQTVTPITNTPWFTWLEEETISSPSPDQVKDAELQKKKLETKSRKAKSKTVDGKVKKIEQAKSTKGAGGTRKAETK